MEQNKFLTSTREEMLAQVDKLEKYLFELVEQLPLPGPLSEYDNYLWYSEEAEKLAKTEYKKWESLGVDADSFDLLYGVEDAIYVLIGTLESFIGRLEE